MTCENVHCGFWINWEQGRHLGWTLTLSKTSGTIFNAFLVLLVGATGTNLWGIICYVIHQLRATTAEEDDIHHQIQVLFRNASTGYTILIGMSKMLWSRKKAFTVVYRRILPFILLSAIYVSAFSGAALLSTKAIKARDQALIRGAECGWQDHSNPGALSDSMPKLNTLALESRAAVSKGAAYTRSCYGSNTTSSLACKNFVQPNIESTISLDVPCPFASRACAAPAMSIDSGWIDSGKHLGINTRDSAKVQLRKTTTFVPLAGQLYTDVLNDTGRGYAFGMSDGDESSQAPNYTFTNSNISSLLDQDPIYDLQVFYSYAGNVSLGTFYPIPDLQVENADVSLISLQNTVNYISEVHDPFYRADKVDNSDGIPTWSSSTIYSFLGYVERWQVCIDGSCSTPSGILTLASDDLNVPLASRNPRQDAVLRLILEAMDSSSIAKIVQYLNQDILLAKSFIYFGFSPPLRPTQWQTEALNLYNTSLAALQNRIIDYASPPDVEVFPGVSSLSNILPPSGDSAALCSKIKIRTTAYISYNALGLLIIIVGAVVIVVTNQTLSTMVAWIRGDDEKTREWVETGVMQLHRIAWEGRGVGPWDGKEDGMPKTMEGGLKFSVRELESKEVYSSRNFT